MVRLFLQGELVESRALQLDHLPLIRALFREPNPIPVKGALQELGFAVGDVRLTLVPVTQDTRDEVVACMRERGLLQRQPVHA
jgi:4-hydroxy-tetrahydrodipicolinate synthase